MAKKIGCFLALIGMILISDNVYASTYSDSFDEHGMWISNEYVNKTKDGVTKYQQMTMIVRKSDGRYVYCIEPGKSLDENQVFTGYDTKQNEYANLTSSQWDRIQLLAYYGYGYNDHTDIKWYVITQFMIWQTNNLGYDIYFTDTLNGNRIDKYTDEMKELDDLVNSQFVIPKFSTRNIEMFWGEEKTFTDLNGVLSNYEISNGDNVEGSINGNQLTIKSNYYGTSYIIFKKTRKRFSNKPIVYINDTSQNLLLPGYLYDVSDRISIKMNYGTISVQKLDSQTKDTTPNHQGSLENAKYGLYSNDGNLLEEKYTNSNGKLTFDTKLNSNNYYIQEISPSNGYLLDSTKYNVNINKDNYIVTKNVYEQVIKENYEIIKILENNKTGLVEFEKGVEFGIYDLNNNLINTYVTDDFGTIKFSLDYGKYIIKQHTSYANYEKIEDFEIEVKENNKNNKYIFQDNKIIYKVKLTVKDKETNDTIKDINFELYDAEKICTNEENCIYTTDENGEINFSNNFDFNDYVIKLITDEKFKYIYDDDTIKFTIDENTEYKEIENYRLVELEYFLQLKKENKIIIEDNQDYDISYNEEEIEENIDEENTNSISQDEDMLVEVPNTLANDNYLNLITLVTISIIIKKYFK